MARAAAKRISQQNASTLNILACGFIASVLIHIVFRLILFRSSASAKSYIYFGATEALAAALWSQLRGMAASGDDLAQQGLTQYFFDIIYVTWFVHIGTALISDKFWWFYLAIPGYLFYFAYRKAIVPFLLGGRDPLAGLFFLFSNRGAGANGAAEATGDEAAAPGMSKRQAKLQKRQERGDPRVQTRQR